MSGGKHSTRDMFIRDVRRSVAGAALRMTWRHFCVAGAALDTDGVGKSQNILVRGRQLRTQLFIFEGSLAELLVFDGVLYTF